MTVELTRAQIQSVPDDQNVAQSHFGRAGRITAREIKAGIRGKPDHYLVTLRGDDQDLKVYVFQQPETLESSATGTGR